MYHHHHHHIVLVARISRTLSCHSSLSFITLGRSSGQHPVSSHSCWMYVRSGRPAFARPYVGVHRSTSLMSSSLLLQQCPACLVRLTWIVFVVGGRWPYSWCLMGCCRQDNLSLLTLKYEGQQAFIGLVFSQIPNIFYDLHKIYLFKIHQWLMISFLLFFVLFFYYSTMLYLFIFYILFFLKVLFYFCSSSAQFTRANCR